METHLAPLRQSTKWFIEQDPTTVTLTPVSSTAAGPGGGRVPVPGVPRTPQQVKLIHNSESGISSGEGGQDRVFEYTILLEHDGSIAIGDSWMQDGQKFVVYAIEPLDGYQIKARARSHGAKPTNG